MAIKALNSIGGFSVGDSPANIILANGDITTINFSANGVSNLGPVGNVKITGGTGGYVLTTDGAGNLSWSATGSPTIIQNGNSNVTVPTGNGNVYINATGADQWIFTTTGNLIGPAAGSANLGNAVYANFFIGSGNNLSNIQAANVSGEVANANYATYAGTAYAVSGANVTGEVANANYATYAGTAYAVSGANVTGEVANANYATYAGTAYSVSGANVSGEVANANYASYAGNATVANTVVNNAQPNITSVGTLSSLSVTGTVTASDFSTSGTGGDLTLTGGDILGANVTYSNSFTSNGGTIDFATNNANVNLGNVANVHIGGGSGGYVLTTDGSGGLSWAATGSPTIIQNGNSNVSVPTANGNVYINATGDEQWVFDTTGNLTGPATGTANLGNLVIANYAQVTSLANTQIPYANASNILVGSSVLTYDAPNQVLKVGAGGTELGGDSGYGYIQTTTGNFSGNINSLNANLGNLVTANYANLTNNLVVQGNISNANNISVTNNITSGSANVTNNLNVGGNIVTGSGSGGNISGVNVITANTFVGTDGNLSGNLITSNLTINLELSGNTANFTGNIKALNANLGNLAIANFVQTGQIQNGNSNIAIAANGNITVSATGTANVVSISNVGTNVVGYVTANGNGTFGALYSNTLTSQGGNLVLSAEQAGNTYIQLRPYGNGTVDVGGFKIQSLAEPTAATDAATKYYVDSIAQGLDPKASVHAASNAAIAVSYTYDNGTSGVGATLTADAAGVLVLNGESITFGQRVLIKDEVGAYIDDTTPSAAFNGIYVLTTEGTVSVAWVLTRAVDFDLAAEIPGAFTFIETGAGQADTGWVCTTNAVPPIVVGTTQLLWSQFAGGGSYTGANGISVSGTIISANIDGVTTAISGGNIVVKANAEFTTPNIGVATGTSLNLTGNLLAGNVNSNAKVTAANIEVTSNVLANNFSANSNITSNNATINLALSGNTANFSGNVILSNLTVNLELAGNTANFTGNINSALNANLGNLVTANYVNVANQVNGNIASFTGNITGANVIANTAVFAPAIVQNASTYDTRVSLDSGTGLVQITSAGNSTQFSPSGQVQLSGASQIVGGVFGGSGITLGGSQTDIFQNRGGNVTVQVGTGGSISNTWIFANNGNTIFPATANVSLGNVVTANTVSVANVNVGNSIITAQTTTTLSTSANQTIAQFTVSSTDVVGVEFFVKGIEAAGLKYSVATVQAVTDGTSVDYAIYGGVRLGGTTGALAVNMTSASAGVYEISLQATPASSNATVWTTQIRLV